MEIFSALLAICLGNSPVSAEFPAQRPATRSFDVFFDMCLNKRLSKQSRGWWFETLYHPLWRHCNDVSWLARIGEFPAQRPSYAENVSIWWRHHGHGHLREYIPYNIHLVLLCFVLSCLCHVFLMYSCQLSTNDFPSCFNVPLSMN